MQDQEGTANGSKPFRWTPRKARAARLVAEDNQSDEQIAAAVRVVEQYKVDTRLLRELLLVEKQAARKR